MGGGEEAGIWSNGNVHTGKVMGKMNGWQEWLGRDLSRDGTGTGEG